MNRKRKKGPLACINGVRGAISLFLAVLMTPFLSIAMLLVETGRYNSAISLLDEAMGVSAVSTLANYDDYLKDRWGLLAVDQKMDLETTYQSYLERNTATIGTIGLSNTAVKGVYALSDTDILKSQILEYSKLNAPTTLASELISTVGDILQFTEKIKSKMQTIEQVTSLLGSGAEVLDSGITLAQSAEDLKASGERLDELKSEYESKYVTFETKVNALISLRQQIISLQDQLTLKKKDLTKLNEELYELLHPGEEAPDPTEETEPTEATDPPEETEPESEEVKAKREEIAAVEREIITLRTQLTNAQNKIQPSITDAKNAQTNYATVLNDIATELDNFRSLVASSQEAVQNIQNNLLSGATTLTQLVSDLEAKRQNLEDKEKDLEQAKKDLAAWESEGHDTSDPSYIAGLEYKIALEEEVEQLQRDKASLEQQVAIYKMADEGLGEMADGLSTSFEDYSDATIGAVILGFQNLRKKVLELNIDALTASSARVTRAGYRYLEVAGYIDPDQIDEYLEAQEEKLKKGTFSAILDGLVAVYNSIMGLSVFFVDDLDAYIDLNYYQEQFGGLPGGTNNSGEALGLVSSIGSLIGDAMEFKKDLDTLKLLDLLTDAKNIVNSAIECFNQIVQFTKTILLNIAELVTGYDRWYLCTYCTYNLACRADFSPASGEVSLKTMSGTSVGKESFPEAVKSVNVPVFGELYKLIQTITTSMNGTGSDRTFSGAEVEYILFGSTSEVANQLYVFAVLYILRVLLCAPAITANAEVQSLAAAATLGYPVVMGLYYVLEPLVSTILLVNGKAQDLIPSKVYLSPSGLPSLIQQLVSFCKFTDKDKEELKEKMIKAFDGEQEDYDYNRKLYDYENSSSALDAPSISLSYKDYCLAWMLLTVSEDSMLRRLSNLIQMETQYYYDKQKVGYTFDLTQSYTYVHAKTQVSVVQMMPTLIDSDLFTVQREQYRGY